MCLFFSLNPKSFLYIADNFWRVVDGCSKNIEDICVVGFALVYRISFQEEAKGCIYLSNIVKSSTKGPFCICNALSGA